MHDLFFRHVDRCKTYLVRKAWPFGASVAFPVLAAALGLAFSSSLFVDHVEAAGGQQSVQPQSQPQTQAPAPAQNPAPADEGTFGSAPGTPAPRQPSCPG